MGIDSEPYVSLECIWIIFKNNLSANESPKISLRALHYDVKACEPKNTSVERITRYDFRKK